MINEQTIVDSPDIRTCVCANLRRTTRMVTQAYDAALRPAGLRATQFTLLAVLAKRGQLRQSYLAEILVVDGTTLTRNLRPLVKNQWIEIDRDSDQRVRLISITAKGRRILAKAVPMWQQVHARFVTGLGDEQWSYLLTALTEATAIAQRD
ncbi:MAG: MarR family winged helix-turn-helix transcriptional regulator [Proteobacteria bacterium]|nr:MarR family winged helix-turn-helix transcriptional regulator [Pseudomonadota bacterium]MDA1356602.1 MarR family winged helix-turn-helix transcriptional regulator [Pseudomonadota bacterium]